MENEDRRVLLYDERCHEIEQPFVPPILTYRFVFPLLLVTMVAWFFIGRSTVKVEPRDKLSGITITNSSWVWIAGPETYEEQKPPSDHPPLMIIANGDEYTIHYARRSEMLQRHNLGQTIIGQKQIWLPDDAEGREARETMLHELMHVALAQSGGPLSNPLNPDATDHDGEYIINPSARMLIDILRDNKKLVTWLSRKG